MHQIPDCSQIFANEYGTSVYIKNVVKAPNIEVGEYSYFDDTEDPTQFEKRCVLFNYPDFFQINSLLVNSVLLPKVSNL